MPLDWSISNQHGLFVSETATWNRDLRSENRILRDETKSLQAVNQILKDENRTLKSETDSLRSSCTVWNMTYEGGSMSRGDRDTAKENRILVAELKQAKRLLGELAKKENDNHNSLAAVLGEVMSILRD